MVRGSAGPRAGLDNALDLTRCPDPRLSDSLGEGAVIKALVVAHHDEEGVVAREDDEEEFLSSVRF